MTFQSNSESSIVKPTATYDVTVIENDGRGEKHYSLFSRLLKDRIIFLGSEVNEHVANYVVGQMLFLQMDDPKKDIHLYINSPGGSVTDGLAIYDTMQFISCDVNTYCIGMCASMGALLLCAGTKGKRFALPNSHIMIHQASGGARGTAADIKQTVEFLYKLNNRTKQIISHHTGQSQEKVEIDCERDNYMTADEAKAYGLVDEVVVNKKDVPNFAELSSVPK